MMPTTAASSPGHTEDTGEVVFAVSFECTIVEAQGTEEVEEVRAVSDEDTGWKEVLVARLHRLSPDAFEEFALYLLRNYGLELERVGGSGDEGIDGIGTAPLSPVLSATVVVQAKRYEPTRAIGRDGHAWPIQRARAPSGYQCDTDR